MSIYATISEIGLKRFEDEAYVEIYVQGVPAHIDYIGPAWDFLPPPVHPDGNTMRAVFFVERGDEKGTPRCGQLVRVASSTIGSIIVHSRNKR